MVIGLVEDDIHLFFKTIYFKSYFLRITSEHLLK